MQSAIHFKTKVLPGRKIELELPQATEGEDVEVIVIMPSTKPSQSRPSVIDILDEIHRRRPHGRSTEEIDSSLQAEREAWGN
ncbi:MAG: hypothetical protein IGR93_16390 [Hydrococcus sp. C42_A2020_068]|nr:hypothetical protein [Hydrococcus sp. C42_A2020_068]